LQLGGKQEVQRNNTLEMIKRLLFEDESGSFEYELLKIIISERRWLQTRRTSVRRNPRNLQLIRSERMLKCFFGNNHKFEGEHKVSTNAVVALVPLSFQYTL